MAKRWFILAAALACLTLVPAGVASAKPLLCERSCEGSWGAFEHAQNLAEKEGGTSVNVGGCIKTGKNQRGVSQWECWGEGYWPILGGGYREDDFYLGLDPYGYTVYFELEAS